LSCAKQDQAGPGTYQLTATPTGGNPRTVTFKITS
jgi:hypothetical protein